MSVINNVLKDLETRTSYFTPIEFASVENLSVAKKNASPLPLVAGIVLFFLVMLSGWVYLQNEQVEVAAIAPTPATVASRALVKRTTLEIAPAN